jgi:multiple sugar transport system ATP-binding protein
MPRIVLEDVSKSFAGPDGRSVAAVDCLTLEVKDREMLVVLGPSGCGKTTTLRLIAGLESADAGTVRFNDEVVTRLPPAQRDVAMVFQSHALLPHLTAFDNLAFGLKLRHESEAEINSRVREAAEWLGLTHCLQRKPGKLSGGERQRVALGRALVRRPKILLLDEPLSHLDEPLRVQMRTELRALRTRLEITLIYVTHDQEEALALGDRVAVMHAGRLQQVGSPRELYETPTNTFVAGFVGSPPMNLFRGTMAQREGGLVFVSADKDKPGSGFTVSLDHTLAGRASLNVGRQVWLGIRPEHVQVSPVNHAVNHAIRAILHSAEYVGSESILRFTVGEQAIVVRAAARDPLQPGDMAALTFDRSHARGYDATTGGILF